MPKLKPQNASDEYHPVINTDHPIVAGPTGPAVFGAIVSLRDGTGGTRRMRTFDFVVERDPDTGAYVG